MSGLVSTAPLQAHQLYWLVLRFSFFTNFIYFNWNLIIGFLVSSVVNHMHWFKIKPNAASQSQSFSRWNTSTYLNEAFHIETLVGQYHYILPFSCDLCSEGHSWMDSFLLLTLYILKFFISEVWCLSQLWCRIVLWSWFGSLCGIFEFLTSTQHFCLLSHQASTVCVPCMVW